MTKAEEIQDKCNAAGCNDVQRAKHRDLFIHRRWDPHPPKEFVAWLHQDLPVLDPERARAKLEATFSGHTGPAVAVIKRVLNSFIERAEANPTRTTKRYEGVNPVTAWNSDEFRQSFYRAVGAGQATQPEIPF